MAASPAAQSCASVCALCGEAVAPESDFVSTGPFLTRRDPLWRYAGIRLHRRCFLAWENRAEFVRKFNVVLDGLATMGADGSIDDPQARDQTLPPP